MPNFNDKTTTKKGKVGETLVLEYLENKGVVVYQPHTEKAHPFDNLCATPDKKTIFIAEVKTKPSRLYYEDTGFNISNYNDYHLVSEKYNLDIYVFFVDEVAGKIYGNWLKELEKPNINKDNHWQREIEYPLRENGIIYFPMCHMEQICDIDANLIGRLKELSTRNYEYGEVEIQESEMNNQGEF